MHLRFAICSMVLLLSSLYPMTLSAAEKSPYFPERGTAAIHQRSIDVSGGAVVMAVALQPGYEDLSMLAYARMVTGAQTVAVYVTNGESTPGDVSGEFPMQLSAARKEEAYQVMTLLGGQAYFLNLPDPGLGRKELEKAWIADTIVTRLALALVSYRPDVLVVQGDFRGDTVRSDRQTLLAEYVRRATVVAENLGGTPNEEGTSMLPWKTPRIVVESGRAVQGVRSKYDNPHPVWKKSLRTIAREAAGRYASLRYQMMRWTNGPDRLYSQVTPSSTKPTTDVASGMPGIRKTIRSLASLVRTVTDQSRGVRSPSLASVASAIDSVDFVVNRRRENLSNADLRLVSTWKNGLEDLRCSILDVRPDVSAGDSLLTEYQVFYLKVNALASKTVGGKDRIIFPMAHDHLRWAVNESIQWQFDLKPPQEFNILSLPPLPYNTPGSQFGLQQKSRRVRFSYIIYHTDTVRARNFAYRGEVLLQTGPKRTFELLTPAVRAIDGEKLVTSMRNISRDGFEGHIVLRDSIAGGLSIPVSLEKKDDRRYDTLALSFPRQLAEGDYTLDVELSGRGGRRAAVARRFDAAIDTSQRIALVTAFTSGLTELALGRLRAPFSIVNPQSLSPASLEKYRVCILDRDVLAAAPPTGGWIDGLAPWVRAGGGLVILPQFAASDVQLPWGSFSKRSQFSTAAPLETDTLAMPLLGPNRLSPEDWKGWVIGRSWGVVLPNMNGHVIVKESTTGEALLVSFSDGEGTVTLVALDLGSQFVNIHPGAHRLLANLVSGRR
jgi:hypothetical protein